MEEEKLNYIIRPAHEADLPFVLHSWSQSYKKGNPELHKCTPNKIYSPWIKSHQANLIQNGAAVIVACSSEDYNQLFGYLVYQSQKPVIAHYLYVKQFYRNQKIATSLLKNVGLSKNKAILCTSTTNPLYKNKTWSVIFLPDASIWIVK